MDWWTLFTKLLRAKIRNLLTEIIFRGNECLSKKILSHVKKLIYRPKFDSAFIITWWSGYIINISFKWNWKLLWNILPKHSIIQWQFIISYKTYNSAQRYKLNWQRRGRLSSLIFINKTYSCILFWHVIHCAFEQLWKVNIAVITVWHRKTQHALFSKWVVQAEHL